MGLKWIFLFFLLAYGVDAFSAIDSFDQLIRENTNSQYQFASEIKIQLGLKK